MLFYARNLRGTQASFFGCLGESIAAIFRQNLNWFGHLPKQTSEVTHEAIRKKGACKLAVERFGFRH